ncbi:MAG: hypothetical protein U0176_08185 [Bacteroidia bacterium]
MEKNPVLQEKQPVHAGESEHAEGQHGLSMSPPPFQLMASPSAPPIQRAEAGQPKAKQGPAESSKEASPQGDFPWDSIVVGGAANVFKTADVDPANLIVTKPQGEIVQIIGQKDTFYEVQVGRKKGFVLKTALKQLSYRLSRNEEVIEVMRGNKTFKAGDKGIPVTIFQQIISETTVLILAILKLMKKSGTDVADIETKINGGKAGMLSGAINGEMDPTTVLFVKAIQKAAGKPESGELNKDVFLKINDFLLLKAYLLETMELLDYANSPDAVAGKQPDAKNPPADLMKHTRNISKDEQKAFEEAISTAPKANAGSLIKDINGVTYEQALTQVVEDLILWYYDHLAKGKAEQHKNKSGTELQDWKQIDNVAKKSVEATDARFGKYRKGDGLDSTKLQDGWAKREKKFKEDPAEKDRAVEWRVFKIINMHPEVKALDREYNAVQSRSEEEQIILRVKEKLKKKYRNELIEVDKGWPGNADGGVSIQIFKEKDAAGKDDNAKNRDYMWTLFNTLIHEYIHTLEHSAHEKFRENMDGQKGGNVLREGITDYFTKIAFNSTDKSDIKLRETVEGPFHEAGVDHPIPNMKAYPESQNAEAAAGVIGFANMCAAFFLGQVDLYRHK